MKCKEENITIFIKKCNGNSSTQFTSFDDHGALPALKTYTCNNIDYQTFTTDLELRIE